MQDLRKYYALVSAFILYLVSCLIVYQDPELGRRWLAFGIWAIAILVCAAASGYSFIKNFRFIKLREDPAFIIILLLCLSRIAFIGVYPYFGIGDALRDGGLRPMQMAMGRWINIFSFDWSQGLTMPAFLSPLYSLFDSSLLLIRVPAAIVSLFDIFLLYFLMKRNFGKPHAFFAALAMICCHYHWYYSRTEVLIAFTGLFTTIFVFLSSELHKKFDKNLCILIALLSGFAFGFHASVWIMSVLAAFIAFLYASYNLRKSFLELFAVSFGMAAAALIGYGPRIIFAIDFYFGFSQGSIKAGDRAFSELMQKYWENLRIIFLDMAPAGHFPGFTLFTFTAGMFFLLGFAWVFYKPKFTALFAVLLVLLVPFVNGALSDRSGAEYRLYPIITAVSILIGYAMGNILALSRDGNRPLLKTFGFLIAAAFFVEQTYRLSTSFTDEKTSNPFNNANIVFDYMLTDTIYLLKEHVPQVDLKDKEICIFTGTEEGDYLKLMHIMEYIEYFLPYTRVTGKAMPGERENPTWSIYFGACPDNINRERWRVFDFCKEYKKFSCPPDKKSYTLRLPAAFFEN